MFDAHEGRGVSYQFTDEERRVFGDYKPPNGNGAGPDSGGEARPEPDWLEGAPMDPAGTVAEPLPSLPGFPFLHAGSGAVIVGPTGGGRSALIQAGLYDAAGAGLRCAYLGCEVTESEFNARAAILAQCRGDSVTDELRESLARVRYLNLASVTAQAEQDPEAWVQGITARYAVVALDPLSAVASALDLDFDKSNAEFIRFYDRLIQPLTTGGVTVLIVDNIGHAEDAKRRAKGASAKSDRADLTFSCSPSASPVGLTVRAQKVRSVRAGFQRGDEWVFVKDSQRIERRGVAAAQTAQSSSQRVDGRVALGDQVNCRSPASAAACHKEPVRVLLHHLLAGFGMSVQQIDAARLGPVCPFLNLAGFAGAIPAAEQVGRDQRGVERLHDRTDAHSQGQGNQARESRQARKTDRKILHPSALAQRLFRLGPRFGFRSALHALYGAPHVGMHLALEPAAHVNGIIDHLRFERFGYHHQRVRLIAHGSHQPVQALEA